MIDEPARYILVPRKDWSPAPPEHIPAPSVWPAALALGSAFMCWGLISTWILTAAGSLLFFLALLGWIQAIRHERNTS